MNVFHTFCGKELRIEDEDIIDLSKQKGDVHINTNNGVWSLHAEKEAFNFMCLDLDLLEPHEVKACIKRAMKLQAFINRELMINDDDPVRLHVRYKARIKIDESSYLDDTYPNNIYNHKFDFYYGDTGGDVAYIKLASFDPDITNKEAMKFLTYCLSIELVSSIKNK